MLTTIGWFLVVPAAIFGIIASLKTDLVRDVPTTSVVMRIAMFAGIIGLLLLLSQGAL